MNFANQYRPRTFAEVVGQEGQAEVLKTMVAKSWIPNAVMLTGPFGTGKTTMARLLSRAVLCDDRKLTTVEPCGMCASCLAMDNDNNPNYTEVDAASQGLIDDIRNMKDQVSYRSGKKTRIVTYDESHMLSKPAQNALLQILEEGAEGVMFLFCTTESQKMLRTIASRCINLQLKLLTSAQIVERLKFVADREGITISQKSTALIGTYVRGHMRDALLLLDQLSKTAAGRPIEEEMVRLYLRLDQNDEIYQLLVSEDKKDTLQKLETLLCNYAASDLLERIGSTLLNAYKVAIGYDNFTQVDLGWLKKINTVRGDKCLDLAESILKINADFSNINFALAAVSRILIEEKIESKGPARSLRPGSASESGAPIPMIRKQGK